MAVKFEAESYKKITLEMMMDYIEKNYPEDKKWFKKVAFQNKNGEVVNKYNHLNCVREFCGRYAPELIPVGQPKKVPPTTRLNEW